MSKKGQITVFIIIGILLIAVIGIVLYLQRGQEVAQAQETIVRSIQVPAEMRPLQDFVQTCMYEVGKDGLNKLGQRGGYLEPRQRYNPIEPTEGAAVQFSPDSTMHVPYWWHLESRNACAGDCAFASERPPLFREEGSTSIEAQLDRYLFAELPNCFGSFRQFREQELIVTPVGELKPVTRITKGNVVIELTYPLEVTRAGERYTLEEFVSELPVNFHEIYTLATEITNLQAEHSFLERAARALIDVFGRTDENALPPVSDLEFGFGTGPIWTEFDVLSKVQQMLTSYVPMLRVTNTRNYEYLPAPLGSNRRMYEVLYNRGFTVPVTDAHPSLNAKFVSLPWWKPYANLNCNGQLCQAEGFNNAFGFMFGVRRYNFAYDLSFPVLVELGNPDSFAGEGYTFRYFLEANLRNNEPLATLGAPLDLPKVEDRSSQLCAPEQRTGGTVTVNVTTSAGAAVDGAEILYRCGGETCGLGTTVNGRLATRFPRCFGGFVQAAHTNYPAAIKPLDILDASNTSVALVLPVPYTVDFRIKKWPFRKRAGNWELDTTELLNQQPQETSIIMLQRKGETFEEPITILGDICGSPVNKAAIPCGNPPDDHSQDIAVYPGDYHVQIYTFMYPSPDVVIPPDRRCYSYRIGPIRKRKCYSVPPKPIVFNTQQPFLSGYAEYDWTAEESQLQRAQALEFYTLYFALDKVLPATSRKIEDLTVMGSLFEYAAPHEDILRPRFIS